MQTATETQTQPVVTPSVLTLTNIYRTYGEGDRVVHALRGVSFDVQIGDYVAIMGASGSGKSTLMNILGCLDVQTSGTYLLDGIDVSGLVERELAQIRNRKLGFVFQAYNLIPKTSALANVELPMLYAGVNARERKRRALAALDLVGLRERIGHTPAQMSGGQQQRVAIARALVNTPFLILADEPTGNLDSASTNDVLDIFDEVNRAGRTIVLITHEDDVAARARRVVRMLDGQIIADKRLRPLDNVNMAETAAITGDDS